MAYMIDRPGSKVGITTTDPGPLDTSSTIADYDDFTCSVASATLTPSASTETFDQPGTFCVPGSTQPVPGLSSWSFDLSMIQDLDDPLGLSVFLAMNDGGTGWVYVSTGATDAAPKFWAPVYLSAAALGGVPAQALTADVSFRVVGQPMLHVSTTIITVGTPTTPVMASATAGFADSET